MRRRTVTCLGIAAGVLGALLCIGLLPVHTESRDRIFEIPKGTWARRMSGDKVEILPDHIRLTLGLRDVLVLHYLHGLSFRETADVLEEPAATVRWRATKALARLRELLKDENEHELAGRKFREPAEESARAPGATLA